MQADLIKQGDNAGGTAFNQVQAALVVLVPNEGPLQPLGHILLLLSLQVMSHKVLLQLLVSVIDTQLLQIVQKEAFKTIHIQQTCRGQQLRVKYDFIPFRKQDKLSDTLNSD